jgi:putative zinc finger/helix-turn-helix YgiT family protein
MRAFCPHCATVQDVRSDTRDETYTVRGEAITVPHTVSVCNVCSGEFSTAPQTQESLTRVREEYRAAHNLVSPKEVVRIRSGYGAGQKPFGLILGLGEATINSYESGELPTTANSNLIRTAADPAVFGRLFAQARDAIGPTQCKRIAAALKGRRLYDYAPVPAINAREEPGPYTGFRRPDMDRVERILGMIVSVVDGAVYKTKLLKLIFLIDFEHFRHHTVSITGWPYARLPHGPVLQDYKVVLDKAEQDGYLQTEDFDDGKTVLHRGPRAIPGEVESGFSEEELATIRDVLNHWGGKTAATLSRYTHELPSWNLTQPAGKISYALALEDERPSEHSP